MVFASFYRIYSWYFETLFGAILKRFLSLIILSLLLLGCSSGFRNLGASSSSSNSNEGGANNNEDATGNPTPLTGSGARFPLEITNIRPVGVDGMTSGNRALRAYPGLPYNVAVVAMGGAYPYTFELTNAPTGMNINSATGEINWSNPDSDASVTVVVRDFEGSNVSLSFNISVTTSGFFFVDAVNGSSGGTGSISNPWRSLLDIRQNAAAGGIVYFRQGLYRLTGLPTTGTTTPPETRVDFDERYHPVIWLAYPGDARPVIDFQYDGVRVDTPRFRMSGSSVYVEGFEVRNSHIMAFQIGYDTNYRGATFRKNIMHQGGPGVDGSNAAFIMTIQTAGGPFIHGTTIIDNEFYAFTDLCPIKTYDQDHVVMANNVFHDGNVLVSTDAAVAIKGRHGRWEVRGNRLYDLTDGIGGNQNNAQLGEIRFNRVSATSLALSLNQNGTAGPIYVYRNTFVGPILVQRVDASHGPFEIYNNVIVNDDANFINYFLVTDFTRVSALQNLLARPADNAVDADGFLTPAYINYLGTHGFQ